MSHKVVHVITDIGLKSETFISQTIAMFEESDFDYHLIYQTRHDKQREINVDSKQIDFAIVKGIYKRLKFLFGSERTKMELKISSSTKELRSHLVKINPSILYTDYGTNAVLIRHVCNDLKIPLIVHLHGSDITSNLSSPSYLDELRKVFGYASRVIVASDHIKRLTELAGCTREKINVIKLGLDSEKIKTFSTEEKTSFPSLVFLGRLTAKKNPIATLHMFNIVQQKFPEARLTIIGDGELRSEVEERIKKLKITDKVDLIGAVNNSEALKLLSKHWIYVQHSVCGPNGDQEGFGISLAEASLLELPVVSTVHNGIPEQVIHGETGYLCQEFNFEEMAAFVVRLIENPEERKKLGEKGKTNILGLCDPIIRSKRIRELLTEVLKTE